MPELEARRKRGRPSLGKKQIHPWIPSEVFRDLEILQRVMRGTPDASGIVADALRDFTAAVLRDDQVVRAKFDAELNKLQGKTKLEIG